MFEYLLLTQFYEALHKQRFLQIRFKRFFVFLRMSVHYITLGSWQWIAFIVNVMVMVNSVCLITRTEINIIYYKLDNIKSCHIFKQSAHKPFTLYLQHYTICRMKNCLQHTRQHRQACKLSEPCEMEAASVRNVVASEYICICHAAKNVETCSQRGRFFKQRN